MSPSRILDLVGGFGTIGTVWGIFSVIALVAVYSGMNCSGSTRHASAPYPASPLFEGVSWDYSGMQSFVQGSDLWPATWASNGNVYTSWGDGRGFQTGDVGLGFAEIANDPPFKAEAEMGGTDKATFPRRPQPGKVGGMIALSNTLYAWVNPLVSDKFELRSSSDFGDTWDAEPVTFSASIATPATFLNFGRGNINARDGFVYSYGGAGGRTDDIFLWRVAQDSITSQTNYEVFSGTPASPSWSTKIVDRQPVFTDSNLSEEFNGALLVAVIHNLPLQRYILTVAHGGADHFGLFDAPEPWGPWTTIDYNDAWDGCRGCKRGALYYTFVPKWTSEDGLTMWLIYSGEGPGFPDALNIIKATLSLRKNTSMKLLAYKYIGLSED